MFQLPNPPTLPVWVFMFLSLVGIIGGTVQKQKSILWATSVTTTITWFLVQLLAVPINNFTAKLAQNPYVTYDLAWVGISLLILVAVPPFIILSLYWRATKNVDEMGQEINLEEDKKSLGLLAMFQQFKSSAAAAKFKHMDINLGTDINSKQKVVLRGIDRFLHTMVFGPTGGGKTSTILKPMIYQDLLKIKSGQKLGITVIEPSGDLCDDVAEMCRKMNIPYIHIDPIKLEAKFNPLQGNSSIAAEATRTVLKGMFGKQEAFFSQVQETAARNVILLLKEVHGDKLDLMDVIRCLRDTNLLNSKVTELEKRKGQTDLVQYFRNELLGDMKDKYKQFAMGLRMQLEDILGNEHIKRTMTGKSSVNLDEHLANGGVLLVNTALGELGKLGGAFGQFILMHLQGAIFRRPGTEWTRTPHMLYVDEFPLYINPEFQRMLAIARKYRCACVLALQTLAQLSMDDSKIFPKIVRNKIIFGGLEEEDAKKFEKDFGQKEVVMKQANYDNHIVVPSIFAKGYRETKVLEPRYPYTKLMELEAFHFIYRLVIDNTLNPPGEAIAKRVDMDKLGQVSTESSENINLKEIQEFIEKIKTKIVLLNKYRATKTAIKEQEVSIGLNEPENTQTEEPVKKKIVFKPISQDCENNKVEESNETENPPAVVKKSPKIPVDTKPKHQINFKLTQQPKVIQKAVKVINDHDKVKEPEKPVIKETKSKENSDKSKAPIKNEEAKKEYEDKAGGNNFWPW